jgi:hypothetical protein
MGFRTWHSSEINAFLFWTSQRNVNISSLEFPSLSPQASFSSANCALLSVSFMTHSIFLIDANLFTSFLIDGDLLAPLLIDEDLCALLDTQNQIKHLVMLKLILQIENKMDTQ